MTENFPNLVKERDTQVQEPQRVLNKINSKRPIPRLRGTADLPNTQKQIQRQPKWGDKEIMS